MKEHSTVVYARHSGLRRPVLRVSWKDAKQVVINLRTRPGDHLTLHDRGSEPILLTVWMADKPPSTHDDTRVAAARAHDYLNPDRHRNYISHQELRPIVNMDGLPLVGWLVDIGTRTSGPGRHAPPLDACSFAPQVSRSSR